jgi:hypothetical protein
MKLDPLVPGMIWSDTRRQSHAAGTEARLAGLTVYGSQAKALAALCQNALRSYQAACTSAGRVARSGVGLDTASNSNINTDSNSSTAVIDSMVNEILDDILGLGSSSHRDLDTGKYSSEAAPTSEIREAMEWINDQSPLLLAAQEAVSSLVCTVKLDMARADPDAPEAGPMRQICAGMNPTRPLR